MLAAKLLGGVGEEKLYVDDVFSAYTYTGNSSTQTITNGIDLAGEGGMVWCKNRTGAFGNTLIDTTRGVNKVLYSDLINAEATPGTSVTAFNSNGYALGNEILVNNSSYNYVGWTFRKAPKFFDVVTVSHTTGTGTSVSFSSLSTIGMVISKRTDSTSNWVVWHRSTGNGNMLQLETTAASFANASAHSVSGTTVTLSSSLATGTYVVYAFAHDPSTDGIIQCGSFTTDGSGNATVNLGWEPQYLLQKSSSAAGNWIVQDSMRGLTVGTSDAFLYPNLSSAEGTNNYITPTATGFTVANMGASETSIYLAIRCPNKPPTIGTQVYNAIARTGTGAAATVTGVGFAPDLALTTDRFRTNYAQPIMWDRLRGALLQLITAGATTELSVANSLTAFVMDGVSVGTNRPNASGITYINHFFKRAPGVFDVVCYTGTGATPTFNHNLGVIPEMIIFKGRNITDDWWVYQKYAQIAFTSLKLNTTGAASIYGTLNATPTSTTFTLSGTNGNTNGNTYVAYLFATKAGISKVGSYTGNGTTQTINCGFTTGARFILIKRTDSTGDWYVWDTVRGIIAGNDPYLSLNTTVAEVTSDDSIDPASSGFIVNQLAATNINVTSASYVFLAIA